MIVNHPTVGHKTANCTTETNKDTKLMNNINKKL